MFRINKILIISDLERRALTTQTFLRQTSQDTSFTFLTPRTRKDIDVTFFEDVRIFDPKSPWSLLQTAQWIRSSSFDLIYDQINLSSTHLLLLLTQAPYRWGRGWISSSLFSEYPYTYRPKKAYSLSRREISSLLEASSSYR